MKRSEQDRILLKHKVLMFIRLLAAAGLLDRSVIFDAATEKCARWGTGSLLKKRREPFGLPNSLEVAAE
jgi:hypothetical protein